MKSKPKSKIARLPKAIRDELNLMFEEGADYKTIRKWLASRGHPDFNDNNLYHWRRGGYQEWRLEEERKHQAEALRRWSSTIALDHDPTLVASALTNFTAARLHCLLGSLDLSAIVSNLQSRPEVCIRYFNSILRASRISLETARVHHSCHQQHHAQAHISASSSSSSSSSIPQAAPAEQPATVKEQLADASIKLAP